MSGNTNFHHRKGHKSLLTRERTMHMETLEERALLSAAPLNTDTGEAVPAMVAPAETTEKMEMAVVSASSVEISEVEMPGFALTTEGTVRLSTPSWQALTVTDVAITASWSAVANASSYTLEYKISSDSSWTSITGINETSATFNGQVGKTYDVRVMAVGSEEYTDSNYSSTKSIKTSSIAGYCASDVERMRSFLSVYDSNTGHILMEFIIYQK